MTPLDDIIHLLHEHCGFGKDHVSESTIRRMAESRALSLGGYRDSLRNTPQELDALTEALVVPETYFFRHPESFAAMREWITNLPRRPVRILSIACSTGEEPYSIVMSLLQAGLAEGDFSVEAWDLSTHAISSATRGTFSANSFRGADLSWREDFFTPLENAWKISSQVKRLVNFRCGNIFELHAVSAFDIIFCRNVLIYFSEARQRQALHAISRALADDGLLFLGPAEPPSLPATEWRMTPFSMSFSCVKRPHAPAQVRPVEIRAKLRPGPVRRTPPPPPAPPRPPAQSVPVDLLEQAHALADRGKLPEAKKILQQAIAANPENSNAHCLMGIVEEAAGETSQAEASYRKAIYLDPSQLEALQHMVLLLERQGRKQAAEQWRRRANKHASP
jgi:chemotaxis protein methyltransferase WspC